VNDVLLGRLGILGTDSPEQFLVGHFGRREPQHYSADVVNLGYWRFSLLLCPRTTRPRGRRQNAFYCAITIHLTHTPDDEVVTSGPQSRSAK
jgi:hypothetical protein